MFLNREESYVVGKKQCPHCASLGKDTSQDNLAMYSDGHEYCFACGYYKGSRVFEYIPPPPRLDREPDYFYIPDDATPDIPYLQKNWLTVSCRMTMTDLINNKILWSPKYQWLIFPIEINGTPVGFQARNFNPLKKYKWYTRFPKKGVVKLFLSKETPYKYGAYTKDANVVIVEDIISAIVVSHVCNSIPLFGSTINDTMLIKIKEMGLINVFFWLDSDKLKESFNFSIRARELGLNSRVICSEEDPKTYKDEQIKHLIGI